MRLTGHGENAYTGIAFRKEPHRGTKRPSLLPAEATGLQWLNGPTGDPFNAAIATLGGTLAHRQHELRLSL